MKKLTIYKTLITATFFLLTTFWSHATRAGGDYGLGDMPGEYGEFIYLNTFSASLDVLTPLDCEVTNDGATAADYFVTTEGDCLTRDIHTGECSSYAPSTLTRKVVVACNTDSSEGISLYQGQVLGISWACLFQDATDNPPTSDGIYYKWDTSDLDYFGDTTVTLSESKQTAMIAVPNDVTDREESYDFTIQSNCEAAGEEDYFDVQLRIPLHIKTPELNMEVIAAKDEIYLNDETTVTVKLWGNAVDEKCAPTTSSTSPLASKTYDCRFSSPSVNVSNPDGGSTDALETTWTRTSSGWISTTADGSGLGGTLTERQFVYYETYKVKGLDLSREGKDQHVLTFKHDGLYQMSASDSVTIHVVAKPRCGNGEVDQENEECDDGNIFDADGCTNLCTIATCGDGINRIVGEECDDGNLDNTDDCTDSCQTAVCGDGYVQANNEECDDGNLVDGDGCSDHCQIEKIVTRPDNNGERVANYCGDGVLDSTTEACDDGNDVDTDACKNDCTLPAVSECGTVDTDGDGTFDLCDNCVNDANADQADSDGDGLGDVCDQKEPVMLSFCGTVDTDGDTVFDLCDNCVNDANTDQADSDGDGTGDACVVEQVVEQAAEQTVVDDPAPVAQSAAINQWGAFGGALGACSLNTVASSSSNGLLWFLGLLIGFVRFVRARKIKN